MAPESIQKKEYSMKSDVYMWAITMWEIFYRSIPYPNKKSVTVALEIISQQIRPNIPPKNKDLIDEILVKNVNHWYIKQPKIMPPTLKTLIEECWDVNKNKRPNFAKILNVLTNVPFHPQNRIP